MNISDRRQHSLWWSSERKRYLTNFSYFGSTGIPMLCQNCDHSLEESFAYCPGCGQRAITRRLQMREILTDFWTQLTDIDKGLFTLLRDLVVRPGHVAREYIGGKRKKHFGPLNFYLIVGTMLILSMNVTEWIHAKYAPTISTSSSNDTAQDSKQASPPAKDQSDGNKSSSRGAKTAARRQAATHFWTQYSDLVSITAAPLLCIFFWIFYRRAGFNYTELLVACLYMMGFTNLVYALIASPITSLLSIFTAARSTYLITLIFKLFEISYFTYFYAQFTQGVVRRPVLRASISSVLVAVFWTVLTFALMTLYIMTGFGLD